MIFGGKANFEPPFRTMSNSRKKRNLKAWDRFGDIGKATLIGAATLLPYRSRTNQTRVSAGTCLIVIKLITQGLKSIIPERRPDGEDDKSFPSEHAAQCTAAAIIIEREYPGKIGASAYALAAAVSLSRVAGRKHHPLDVAAGALIGCAGVWGAAQFNSRLSGWRSLPDDLEALSKV